MVPKTAENDSRKLADSPRPVAKAAAVMRAAQSSYIQFVNTL